jgi:hypothetical protein
VIAIYINVNSFTLSERLPQEGIRKCIIQQPHNGSSKRSGTMSSIKSLPDHFILKCLGQIQGCAFIVDTPNGFSKLELCDT